MTRDTLIAHAWPDTHVTDDALVQAVGAVRRALDDDPRAPAFVETVHGRGYRFIGRLREPADVAGGPLPIRAGGSPLRRVFATTLALAALAAIWTLPSWLGQRATPTPRVEFSIPVSGGEIPVQGGGSIAISRDGHHVVFSRRTPTGLHLAHRAVGSDVVRAIPGTEGAEAPFLSADARRAGFFVGDELRTIPLEGGRLRVLGKIPDAAGAAFAPDGSIFVGTGRGISRIDPASRTTSRLVTRVARELGDNGHRWPYVFADGKAVLFTVWAGSTERSRIDMLDLISGEQHTLLAGAGAARADVPGQLTFMRGTTLMAAPLSVDGRRIEGAPRVIAGNVFIHPYAGAAHYGLSATGTLAYVTGGPTTAPPGRLQWATPPARPGRLGLTIEEAGDARAVPSTDREPIAPPPGPVKGMQLSPDGSRLAMVVEDGGGYRTWILDLATGERRLALASAALSTGTAWSPDGRRLALAVPRPDHDVVIVDARTGSVVAEYEMAEEQFPVTWVPDRGLVYETWSRSSGWDLWLLPNGGGSPVPVAATAADERQAAISPAGRLAYRHTDRAGAGSVRIRSLGLERRSEIVVEIDTTPVWTPGGELLGRRGDTIVTLLRAGSDFTPDPSRPILIRPGLLHFTSGPHGILLYVADAPGYHELRVVVDAEPASASGAAP